MGRQIKPRPPKFAEGDRVEVSESSPFGAGLVGTVLLCNEAHVGVVGKRWDLPDQPVETAVVAVAKCAVLRDAVSPSPNLKLLLEGE